MNPPAAAVRLAPHYDAERLADELTGVRSHTWERQRIRTSAGGVGVNTDLDWRVLPVRSPGGDAHRTDPGGPGPVDFGPTAWADRLPYLRTVLAAVPAPLNAVRLMALGPATTTRTHRDPKYTLRRGLVRLHLPLLTHPAATVCLDGVEYHWPAGQLWYGDFSRQHAVRNAGPTDRVHAVIDALFTRELGALFPPSWRTVLTGADVLYNQLTPGTPAVAAPGRYAVAIPQGFLEFDHDRSLTGPPRPARLDVRSGRLTLTVADRTWALTPAGDAGFRFVGWSEQRTLHLDNDRLLLRQRHGAAFEQRSSPLRPPG